MAHPCGFGSGRWHTVNVSRGGAASFVIFKGCALRSCPFLSHGGRCESILFRLSHTRSNCSRANASDGSPVFWSPGWRSTGHGAQQRSSLVATEGDEMQLPPTVVPFQLVLHVRKTPHPLKITKDAPPLATLGGKLPQCILQWCSKDSNEIQEKAWPTRL